jgi:hypothetical protein
VSADVATLDLRAAVRRAPIKLPTLRVPAQARAAALANWRARMASELASARVFSALVPQAMRANLGYERIAQLTDMAREEVEHGLLCAKVVAALGGDPTAQVPPLEPVPVHEGCDPLEVVVRNVLSVSCCSETVAVALVGTEREQAALEPLERVLRKILADEVGHARFGWRLLEDVAPSFDAAMRRRLTAYLVLVFEHELVFHGAFLRMDRATDAGLGIGAPDGAANWACFVETMTTVTIPGLEKHGLKAAWAWERALASVARPPAMATAVS